jgi:GMP synthase (glutamine-hydrolysing)
VRLLVVVHQKDAGLGAFLDVLEARRVEAVEWRPASGEGAPPGDFDAVLVLGGSAHPHQLERFPWLAREKEALQAWIDSGMPVLGVCLGAELVGEALGGSVVRLGDAPEIGWFEIEAAEGAATDPVMRSLPRRFNAFQWHSFGVSAPPGAEVLAEGAAGPNAFRKGSAWGIQFHPEVTPEIVRDWLDDWDNDEDAVATGFDPEPVRRRTDTEIEASQELGRSLLAAFLDYSGVT